MDSTDNTHLKAHMGFYYANKNWWVKGYDYYNYLKSQEGVTLKDLEPYAYFFERLYSFYMNLGDYYNSAHALEMALQLEPDIILGWESLGHCYRNAGALDEALRAYKQGIAHGNKISSTYSHMAIIYEKLNNTEETYYFSKKALKIDPKNIVAKNIIKRIVVNHKEILNQL